MADEPSNNDAPAESPRTRGFEPDSTPRNPIKWKLWVPALAFLLGSGAIYFVKDIRRGQRLRVQLIAEHTLLTESLAPPYRRVRERIERLTFASVRAYAGDFAAPGFTAMRLAAGPVLYGRVRAQEIQRIEQVSGSIRHRYPDQIATCLGLEVDWVHQFYIRGDFLMPTYVQSVGRVADGDRLAALRQDLQFRLRRDTPDIVAWSRRSLFVLAVDEGASSIDGPSRLYVFDLEQEQPLMRVRDEGGGTMIIPFSLGAGGRAVPRPAGPVLTVSQHDCSVANAARQLLGVTPQTMTDPTQAPAVPQPNPGNSPPADAAAPAAGR